MIVCHSPQGSPEWFADRAGAITGSMYPVIMAKVGGLDERQQAYVDLVRAGMDKKDAVKQAGYKSAPTSSRIQDAIDGKPVGDWSGPAYDYAFRLAVERISGEALTDDQFETYYMRRGKELEPEAREAHEFAYGIKVEPCGFIKTGDGKFGVSADGLIGKGGGSEYKCFLAPEKLRAIHIDNDIGDVIWQVQGGMWLTGRSWWHFGLYCPALAACGKSLKILEFERDEAIIQKLEQELIAFDRLVESYREQLEAE